jgi:HEAT repeat protein
VKGEATYGGQMWGWLLTAISKIGPDAPTAVAALKRTLKRCLDSPDRLNTLTIGTAQVLGIMGRPAHTAVPLLTLALGRVPIATSSIAAALSHMMPEAVLAVPTLVRTLDAGQSPEVIVDALGTMGPPAKSALPTLHRTLAAPSPVLACRAFAAIAHIEGEPNLTLPESVATLQQIDERRLSAIYAALAAVKLQGTKAESAIPALVRVVNSHKEPWLRRTAIETLAAVGPAGNREAALTLIAAARRQDPVIALEADQAFEEFGTAAKQVPEELSALLLDNGRGQSQVLMLLGALGPEAALAMPNLTKLLRTEANVPTYTDGMRQILWLLQKIGPDAREAIPVLTDMILEPGKEGAAAESSRRTALLTTLMRIGMTPRVLPAVREMLASNQQTAVACAAHAVALLGRQAADTVPLLLRPLRPDYKDSMMTSGFFYGYVYETSARNECMRALASLGPAAKEALPLLQSYADLPENPAENSRFGPPALKGEAQRAIQAIQQALPPQNTSRPMPDVSTVAPIQRPDPEREKRIKTSLALLEHGTETEQATAVSQVTQLGLPPAQVVPLLQAHLQRHTNTASELLVIKNAVQALDQYNQYYHGARIALPDLIRLLDDVGTVQGEATHGLDIWYALVNAMRNMGPNDPDVVAAFNRALRRCLDRPDRLIALSDNIVGVLEFMGPAAHTAAPLLTLALNAFPNRTYYLAQRLSHMMPEAAPAIPTMTRLLEAGHTQDALIDALGTMGPAAKSALPALNRALALPSPILACKAFAAIAHIKGQPTLTLDQSQAVLQQIDQHSIQGTYTAFTRIKQAGPEAKETIPTLVRIVKTRHEPWLQRTAVETLAAVGPTGNREAALVLLQTVHSQDPVIALDDRQAFENFGTTAEQVLPEMNALLRTEKVVPDGLLKAFAAIGPKAAPVVPHLLRLLQKGSHGDLNGINVGLIYTLLIKIGPAGRETVPFLTDLILQTLHTPRTTIAYARTGLLNTLMQIEITPRVLPVIREMLQSVYTDDIACAAHAVARFGPQAADMIPLLIRPLRQDFQDREVTPGNLYGSDQPTTVRNECMHALASFGPAAKAALPLLQTYADLPASHTHGISNGPRPLRGDAQLAIQAILQTKGTE